MREIPELLARKTLPSFMKVLGDCQVQSHQLLFAAVGDGVCDQATLQVNQFEATGELRRRKLAEYLLVTPFKP